MLGGQPEQGDLRAINSALRAQMEEMLKELNRRTADLRAAQERVAQLSQEVTSTDGMVTVRVDATGALTDLVLSPRAFERSTPERLGQTIKSVIQQATAAARNAMQAEFAPLTEGVDLPDLPDLVPGAPSIRDLVITQPPVPPVEPAPEPGAAYHDSGQGRFYEDDPEEEPVVSRSHPGGTPTTAPPWAGNRVTPARPSRSRPDDEDDDEPGSVLRGGW
ncbi:MAG TPA: YbaB/EbfC family nucleoid-associated protein [Pseudonocardiaceae bacterium]